MKFLTTLAISIGLLIASQAMEKPSFHTKGTLTGKPTGTLKPGMQLPTVRQLAVDLQVNANTVARVYNKPIPAPIDPPPANVSMEEWSRRAQFQR